MSNYWTAEMYLEGWYREIRRAEAAERRAERLRYRAETERARADALEREKAAWMGLQSGTADVVRQLESERDDAGEPSCCAQTRERCARIAESESGPVFKERPWLSIRLLAILRPTASLRIMARTTRKRVAADIRRAGDTP
jgi:hypothetical protein